MKNKDQMIIAMKKELQDRKDFLGNEEIETIYFGGGTPSVLKIDDIVELMDELNKLFAVHPEAEITLEANPDDLDPVYLKELNKTGINRLSIGIQSFYNELLQLLNRRHNAEQAIKSVIEAKEAGFENITIDLIYGIPGLTVQMWEKTLDKSFSLPIKHLSAYHLTYEPKTIITNFRNAGKIKEADEEVSIEQFEMLIEKSGDHQFIHYEISNFAKKGWFSKHNTSYWQGKKYLGIGPSAHSFDGTVRLWNVSDNKAYIENVTSNRIYSGSEILTKQNQFNEYIMTSLRTMWGLDLEYVLKNFGKDYHSDLLEKIDKYIKNDKAFTEKNKIYLTDKGKIISDTIISELFMV
jgi:oxygen-independent coproporphyrinogen-3 oxidase